MLAEMRNNAPITTFELMHISGLGKTPIQKYAKELVEEKALERVENKKRRSLDSRIAASSTKREREWPLAKPFWLTLAVGLCGFL